ncbi:MAG: hypothetical protein ACI4VE_05535 [Clostridia bacterium]
MAYQRVNWQSGTKVADGYVEINGTKHTTVQPQYSGSTPINPTSLNIMDKGIFDNSQDIEQNTQDIQENTNNIHDISNKINGLSSINKIFVGKIECKNLWPLENEIRVTKSTSFQTNLPAGVYTISGYITGDDAVSSAIKFYDNNENVIATVLLEHNIHNIHQTFNLSSACTLVRVYSNDTVETSTNKTSIFEDMQLEPGDVVTEYTERKKIIPDVENSLDSDSTENVPSVHAVNSKFAVLTGTISVSSAYTAQEQVDYPTGFTKDNCVVISQMLNNMGGANYSSGYNGSISQQPLISLGDKVAIRLAFDASTTANYDYKVVLMKI